MTIAQRLYMQIIITVLALAGMVGFSMVQMNKVYQTTNYSNVNVIPSLLELDNAFRGYATMRTVVWQYLITSDPATRASQLKRMNDAHDKLTTALAKYEKDDITDDKDRALLAAETAGLKSYDEVRVKALALSDAGKMEEARDLLLANTVAFTKISDAFDAHGQYNMEIGKRSADEAAGALKQANTMAILIALLTIAGTATLGVMIARKLVKSLSEAVHIAETVAAGDLTSQITVTSNDETGKLMQALKDMNANLVRIVGEVRTGTDTIATASSQIAAGNLDLSSRTEQQASSLEETASSMEEMTSTVRQNADNARQANVLAASASDVAIKGGTVVAQVVDTMGSINESARKIVDIISVIDGIAFQTNILALNAAVEAARAGEQGRGFAVVATEVRNLAQRSASAAKEIKTLINDSVEKVDAGSKLVDQAGLTMHEVVESVRRVSDIINEITSASSEQSSGIDQINQAVAQMDQVTQQNAALVEEAAAAAGSLQDQAGKLASVVSVFKVDPRLTGSDNAPAHAIAPRRTRSAPLSKPSRSHLALAG